MYNQATFEKATVFPIFKHGDALHTADEQLKNKPAIDDVICFNLDGEALKDALFVIDNIRENKMKIKWFSVNVWTVRYKGRYVCDLRIENDSLVIGEISGVLTTRVKTMPHSQENVERFINALRDSITVGQRAYATN